MNSFGDRMRFIRRTFGAQGDRTKCASFARELGANRFTVNGWEKKADFKEPECGLRGLAEMFARVPAIASRGVPPTALAAWVITGDGDVRQLLAQPETRDPPAAPPTSPVPSRLPELAALTPERFERLQAWAFKNATKRDDELGAADVREALGIVLEMSLPRAAVLPSIAPAMLPAATANGPVAQRSVQRTHNP